MIASDSVTVFTTPERADVFKAVFGEAAHYRFDPFETAPLADSLANLAIAGGSVAVIDERHCLSAESMYAGIADYVDSSLGYSKSLRIIAVCPDRKPGDELLTGLAAFCGVHDIIYNKAKSEVVLELERVWNKPNKRYDVKELLDAPHWREHLHERKPKQHSVQSEFELEAVNGAQIVIKIASAAKVS